MNANQLQQQLMALAGNNGNVPFSEQLLNAATGHQLMNHQAFNGRLQNELENLEDEEELCDSDDLTYDEEEDSDFDFDESEVDGLERPDQTKSSRKLSRFRLFGQSPKLLKKFKYHQKDKRTIGHNTTVKPGDTTDAPTAWISMGEGKMLDEDQNLVDQPKLPFEKSLNEEKDKNVFVDETDTASIKSTEKEVPAAKKSVSNEKLSSSAAAAETSTSLNSSQSSFVQLTTKVSDQQATGKETPKHSPKSSTSLASKWFGRKSGGAEAPEKTADSKKKAQSKSAPQITQVIYKRKPNLPELPEKPCAANSKEIKQDASLPTTKAKQLKQTVSVPSDEETDLDDRIYAEINETALVLEEMKRSLDKNSTERKIIEMILQQPANVPDNPLASSADQLKVK